MQFAYFVVDLMRAACAILMPNNEVENGQWPLYTAITIAKQQQIIIMKLRVYLVVCSFLPQTSLARLRAIRTNNNNK